MNSPTIHIPAVQAGRLRTHPSGAGWCIAVEPDNPDTPIIDRQGEPLTASEAEEVLDQLDNGIRRKWKQ